MIKVAHFITECRLYKDKTTNTQTKITRSHSKRIKTVQKMHQYESSLFQTKDNIIYKSMNYK